MQIGLFAFSTDYSMPIDALAVAAEERGFDSIWLPEHTHIPVSRDTAYPGGGELPKAYSHTLDPFVALGIAAGVTSKLKLATGVCLATEHQALTLAKTVATLDHVSNGRVLLGLGAGWNREEMENHGTAYAARFKKLEEQLQALRVIWSEEEASFQGEFERFDAVWSWPKPVQKPHPPLILGGETDYTLRRIVRLADGWLPRSVNPDAILQCMTRLDAFARDAGRDPASVSVSIFAPPPTDEVVQKFRDTRAERVILMVPPGDEAATLKRLDRYAAWVG
ncbi:MAG: LLM class F420-dependent oxidoreductase [Pseudomonadales bacterium]|jgi:probable F420-dependent oxidoreductase|nr:LLM class F420-dependent oxidoreductase [Pseudomonadales bacterium]MDP6469780.1 LLM class F420-dependent oxidoreductase [Pseudomonadales bacterium]MDP6827617.1 LLM class F420-dependent oxidoreductase [Pseudomonadales bacterium]MDP6972424.1 LLM class F420-dependent oxidoreductase [Pseudomonadales bacterium]